MAIIDELVPAEMNADERNELAFNWIRDNAPDYVLQYLDALDRAAELAALRERVGELEAARKWLEHIYVNATSDDVGEDFRFYFEPDEILAIEAVLGATAEGGE